MEKISKLATVVAKVARMEKKAKQFKLNMDDTTITVNDTTDQFTEEEIKQAMAKENPTIYWSDDRNKHWFFDFPFEKDGKRYWISSQNITNDLKNIDIMVFEGNNKGSYHKAKLNKKANIYGKIDDYLETLNYFERGLYARGGIWVSFKDDNALNSFKKFLDDLKINYKEYALGNDFYDDDNGDRQTIYIKSEEWRDREASKTTNLTKKAVRKYTNMILDYMDQGILSPIDVAKACLSYMSEDDVQDMAESNDFIIEEEEEEEKEITDLDKESEIDFTLRMDKFKKIREELERKYNYKKDLDFFDNYDNEVTNKYEELGGTFEYDKEYDGIEIDEDILVKALQQLAEEEEEASE